MGVPAGMARFLLALFTVVIAAAYCTAVGVEGAELLRASKEVRDTRSSPAPEKPSPESQVSAATPAAKKKKKAAPKRPRPPRAVGSKAAFARVRGVPLYHPAKSVERVAFHQASDPKSLNMTPTGRGVRSMKMPTRHRPTSRHTAVDIVVNPRADILAPVSGIVKRAGQYSLYCKALDNFVIISPDGHPEIEVKILHISGRRARAGDRVVAGKTVIATQPTKLPFGSQVDAFTAKPAWPHVHIEATKLDVPSAVPDKGPSKLAFSAHCN